MIKAIHESGLRYYERTYRDQEDNIKILLCAPTGKAAFNIDGSTLHASFSLPFNQKKGKLSRLSDDKANTTRVAYQNLQLIIIDEISMVSSKTLFYINQRLQQIFNSNEFFGGKSVLLVGDLSQLPPVLQKSIFLPNNEDASQILGNPLWDLFQSFELTEIMRQKDDYHFASALNHLAVGELSNFDLELFQKRQCNIESVPSDSIHLFTTNEDVNSFNAKKINECDELGIISISQSYLRRKKTKNFDLING